MIDEKRVIKKLQDRIDDFVLKHPDKKDSEAVETIREFIHLLEEEAKEQRSGWILCSEKLKKAIRYFECMKNEAMVVLDSGFGTHQGESNRLYKNRKMYAELAIQVLKKQIPQKPNYEGDGYDDNGNLVYDTWICPCCEKSYEVDYDDYDVCPNCGQRIDWSEEIE